MLSKLNGTTGVLLTLLASAVMVAATPTAEAPHERKEVAGLAVVFGAEPEPALTDEMQFLRWRVSDLESEEPYETFEDAKVVVTHEGTEYGPFTVRAMRRTPGTYQTQHIFTVPGEYTSVLSFRKGDDAAVHSVDFDFNIADRSSMELPPRRKGGR
jgi:hypothetical protein